MNGIDPIQALLDAMTERSRRERSITQMTLGKLIERLQEMPGDALVDDIREPHSYRGYYSDLAFERFDGKANASDLLTMCKSAMGQVFVGYKGGDFAMDATTPIWIAHYGCCGLKLMGIADDGELQTAEYEM